MSQLNCMFSLIQPCILYNKATQTQLSTDSLTYTNFQAILGITAAASNLNSKSQKSPYFSTIDKLSISVQKYTIYYLHYPTLNKHRRGCSDVSSSQYNRQTLHILVVDCDLFIVLQFQHVVLADSDGDSSGTRRAEGVRQPHSLLLPNNDENRNGTIWFLGKKINIILLQGYCKRMVGFH